MSFDAYLVWSADVWFWLRLISFVLTVPLVAGVLYISWRILHLRREEHLALRSLLQAKREEIKTENEAWQRVLTHLAAANPNEWKLGIIEADNLLDALVKTMNYPGESLGERLKHVEPSDFKTLNEAWEAHKVRNRIAHEPNYQLSEREARQTIANYQAVFEEFGFI